MTAATAASTTPIVPSAPVAADDYVTRLVNAAPPLNEDQAALVGSVLGGALRGDEGRHG